MKTNRKELETVVFNEGKILVEYGNSPQTRVLSAIAENVTNLLPKASTATVSL
jgi:hypothetical protein